MSECVSDVSGCVRGEPERRTSLYGIRTTANCEMTEITPLQRRQNSVYLSPFVYSVSASVLTALNVKTMYCYTIKIIKKVKIISIHCKVHHISFF